MKRPSSALALTLALAAGCAKQPQEAPGPRDAAAAATIVVASLSDIDGVNPLIAGQSEVNQDLSRRMLFRPLLIEQADFRQGPPSFEPALAESWEASEDGLSVTFELRADAVWSDGEPITADDVRWTWQAQTSPEIAWHYASSKERIEDVEIVDERTVTFRFSEVYPAQLTDANEGEILPRHAWGKRPFSEWRSDARWFVDNLVTSGPFELASWQPNEQIDLRRSERYYNADRPRLGRIVLRVIPDKAGQVNQLLGGSVDYVQQVPRDLLQKLEDDPGVEIDSFWSRQYDYLCWNTRHPVFADVEIRRALTQAIDRQQIIDTLLRGYARRSIGPILSSVWAFNRRIEPWPHDPKVARLILARKGFDDTDGDGFLERDRQKLSFELVTNAGNRLLIDAGTMIQEQLRQIGVEVRLRTLEWRTFVERVTSHDFDASLGGWNIDTSLDIGYAFHSDKIDNGYNFGSYSNAELDRLIDEAKLTSDVEEKRRILHRLQEILHEEQPYTFLWEPKRINARSARLRGTRPDAISSFSNLEEWWVE